MAVQQETEYCKADGKRRIWYVETHVVEHCNMDCAYCDHFSCLAEPKLADVGVFVRDLTRLRELSSGMERLRLLGGEPLLHPAITEFFEAARAVFPGIVIDVITNGVLLPKMSPAFFESMKKNRIAVAVSPYFAKEHKLYEAIKGTYDRYGVPGELRLLMGSCYEKRFSFIALDRSGSQDKMRSFGNCWHAGFRIFLREGKIFPCPIAPNIVHFHGHFKEARDFPLTEKDCIDIYQAKSEEEVVAFLSKPIDFCRFCNVGHRSPAIFKYSPSKREQWEWVYN
jgi:uncharacterized Fe-S cluster-containing radical SAM superfamily protein